MKLKALILILALQTAWVIGTAAYQERVLQHGTTIVLETRLVDPRDMLRGDYVILSYPINDVPRSVFAPAPAGEVPHGTTVHVALTKRGQFYQVNRASLEALTPDPGEVVISGKSAYAWFSTNTPMVRVEYGLERYYVPEGTGRPSGKMTVEAAVAPSGHALIRNVYVDGKLFDRKGK